MAISSEFVDTIQTSTMNHTSYNNNIYNDATDAVVKLLQPDTNATFKLL